MDCRFIVGIICSVFFPIISSVYADLPNENVVIALDNQIQLAFPKESSFYTQRTYQRAVLQSSKNKQYLGGELLEVTLYP